MKQRIGTEAKANRFGQAGNRGTLAHAVRTKNGNKHSGGLE
jgi:hypothetical protein